MRGTGCEMGLGFNTVANKACSVLMLEVSTASLSTFAFPCRKMEELGDVDSLL